MFLFLALGGRVLGQYDSLDVFDQPLRRHIVVQRDDLPTLVRIGVVLGDDDRVAVDRVDRGRVEGAGSRVDRSAVVGAVLVDRHDDVDLRVVVADPHAVEVVGSDELEKGVAGVLQFGVDEVVYLPPGRAVDLELGDPEGFGRFGRNGEDSEGHVSSPPSDPWCCADVGAG